MTYLAPRLDDGGAFGNIDMSDTSGCQVKVDSMKPEADRTLPVFLVGCPRSGTTWLQAMLASHPQVHTGPEMHFFAAFQSVEDAMLSERDRKTGLPAYLTNDGFYAKMRELFWDFASRVPASVASPTVFLEKSPGHCLHAAFIVRTFPQSRFIHLVRDPRNVVASLTRVARTWAAGWAPQTVDAATVFWIRHLTAARQIPEMLPDASQYRQVRYEDLRNRPGESLRSLLEWLGLPITEDALQAAVISNGLDVAATSSERFKSIPQNGNCAAGGSVDYPSDFIGAAAISAEGDGLTSLQRKRVEALTAGLRQELGYPNFERELTLIERCLTSGRLRSALHLRPL